MEKVQLIILGLSPSTSPQNSYAVILKELNGNRTLPIIIGAFEAQSIALEIEGRTPARPMAHDLIKTLIYSTNISLTEVLFCDYKDGVFFSRLVFAEEGFEVDCRPSDAIAIALRCNAPIYIADDILEEIGLVSQVEIHSESLQAEVFAANKPLTKIKIETLESRLEKAIKAEEYEVAAKIRDELKKFLESQ